MNERKVITRTAEDDYSLSREKSQKISFQKIQEILQRNVAKTVSKTYVQYNRETLDTYAQSPLNNIDNIREVSRFLTRVSMLYKQMISYFSTMPLYTYNITPLFDKVYTGDYNADKLLSSYEKSLKIFHHLMQNLEPYNL